MALYTSAYRTTTACILNWTASNKGSHKYTVCAAINIILLYLASRTDIRHATSLPLSWSYMVYGQTADSTPPWQRRHERSAKLNRVCRSTSLWKDSMCLKLTICFGCSSTREIKHTCNIFLIMPNIKDANAAASAKAFPWMGTKIHN